MTEEKVSLSADIYTPGDAMLWAKIGATDELKVIIVRNTSEEFTRPPRRWFSCLSPRRNVWNVLYFYYYTAAQRTVGGAHPVWSENILFVFFSSYTT